MKKLISFLLLIVFLISLSSCKREELSAPSCEELISAYERAGYNIFHKNNEFKEDISQYNCYVKAWLDDENEYVFFHFFDDAESAEEYCELRDYNIIVYLFSLIYGDPSWLYTKTYGNIEYEYDNPELIKPFKELI